MDTQKQKVYQACLHALKVKAEELQLMIHSIQESKNNETKSSAGDKYETARAMMQMEEDKITAQLDIVRQQLSVLARVDPLGMHTRVQLGSLVQTSARAYFLSVSLGKLMVDDQPFFCISPDSPIGQLLWTKAVGDTISFRGVEEEIVVVS